MHPHQAIGNRGHAPPQLQSRQSSSSLGSGGRSSSAGTKPQPLKPRNQFSDPAAAGGNQSSSCVGTSKSLNSFQRQESAASFQSGTSAQSTQSAPTCPNHAHHKPPPNQGGGQQMTSAQSLHHHMGSGHTGGNSRGGGRGSKHHPHAYDGRSSMMPHAASAPLPPPLPQHGIGKQHGSVHHHMGMLPPPPPPQQPNFESCSTQSSSSSASAPPDYATYPG